MKKDVYKLTNPQRNIWELEQTNKDGSKINHILAVLKLKGNLREDILIKTINKMIEKNDSLRIKFVKNGNELCQYITDYEYTPIETKYFSTDDIEKAIEEYNNLEITLDKLFSFGLVFTPNYTYVLYKTHHIIADAWSVTQAAEQVKEFYEKLLQDEAEEAFEKPSYISFIEREQSYLESNKYNIDEEFWKKYVEEITPTKLFNNNSTFEKSAKRYTYQIDENLFSLISNYCETNKITEYSFFLGILSIYFAKIYNLKNIVFGTPFLNRQKRLNELICTGMFISTLPLSINIDINSSFLELCKKIGTTNISLFKHSGYPYHKIQELYCEHSKEVSSLYEVGFSYQINKQENSMENDDFGECSWIFSGEQYNPLTIHLTTLNNDKVINYDYLTSCFSEINIKKMNDIIIHIISQVLENKNIITDINVLTDEDVKSLNLLNATGDIQKQKQNQNKTVINIFNEIVKKYPENIAITYDDINITYSELNKKINTISKVLINLGVTKNTPVALFFDKSVEMIASMFAVLKAGGCYVPILPDEDETRIKYIINDCKPKCILTHKDYEAILSYSPKVINIEKLENQNEQQNIFFNINLSEIKPEDIAYIIYTSGSTGAPKGTMVMHKNICSLKTSIENDNILNSSSEDVSISLLKYSFDASGIDIYTSLLFGGRLVLVKKEDELNPQRIISIMEKEKVTRSFLIPKWIEHIAIQDKLLDSDLSSLKILGTGGETLKPYIVENLLAKYPNLKVINLYGPTETTMFTTYKKVSVYEIKNNYVSLGKPIYGSRVAIINSNHEFMPLETIGELIIYEDDTSIKNISKGYLNLDEQTKKRFIKIYHPILKKYVNAYITGDIAKINKDLEIEFVGRDDDIVKVNGGYLVALNEVENRIQKILGNNFEVVPIAIPYKNSKAIILFITSEEKNITLSNIKTFINSNISFYMKPKKIIELKEFPRNSSGKIDKKELTKMAIQNIEENRNKIVPAKTDIEKEIYEYLKSLIGAEEISITDDFIDDLGIDSLSLTAIYTYLDKYNITIQDIYNNSNIKDLANYIEANSSVEIKPDLSNISNIHILNNVEKFNLETVLITGVTGFLGIHVLKDLLENDQVKKIYCIIRNRINLNGRRRLAKMIEYYFNSDETLLQLIDEKVTILNGDTSKENLGLDKKSYEESKENTTTVINCAANVKHFIKLSEARKDNVQSIQNLINFCEDTISLAHISTLSIAGFNYENTQSIIFDENTLFIGQEFNNNPYLISKFEAEKVVLEATNNKNLNAVIFRLGNIMPRMSDGVFQENANQNVFISAVKAFVDTGLVARDFLGFKIEFSPVDICSKMILSLLENYSSNSIYHILSDKEVSLFEIKALLKTLNYDILEVDFKTFIEELDKNVDEYTKEYILNNNLNQYSQSLTLEKLDNLGLKWLPIDANYMQNILNIIGKK